MRDRQKGFTMIELLIVIAIIGLLSTLILSAVRKSKEKAHDNSIRNAVRQMRWLAEEVYDSQGASYMEWATKATTEHPKVAAKLDILYAEVEKHYGAANTVVILDSQIQSYCISAPLKSDNKYYCIDASGVFSTISTPCTYIANQELKCPNN